MVAKRMLELRGRSHFSHFRESFHQLLLSAVQVAQFGDQEVIYRFQFKRGHSHVEGSPVGRQLVSLSCSPLDKLPKMCAELFTTKLAQVR